VDDLKVTMASTHFFPQKYVKENIYASTAKRCFTN